jgi:hypothetical protein
VPLAELGEPEEKLRRSFAAKSAAQDDNVDEGFELEAQS